MRNADGADPGGSWSSDPGGIQATEADRGQIARTGLRLFLVVVSSLFFLFLFAFIARSQMADWLPLTDPLAPLANLWQLWLNSAFSGIQLHRTAMVAHGRPTGSTGRNGHRFLHWGAYLPLPFWWGNSGSGSSLSPGATFVASNPANSFFYLLTGLHGLHLLGGLIAWGIIVAKFLRRVPLPQLSVSVELCTIYWHYLLGLWFVLFALLASTPQTYEAIARFCGLR